MLQQDEPDDYVIATGRSHSVAELAALAFEQVGLDWREHVVSETYLYRTAEPQTLVGDARKAAARLGWRPTVSFDEHVAEMVREDLASLQA
jgi:GDPmannose 4,6-dehydratase